MRVDDQELVRRYKRNYSLPEEALVTEDMVRQHWELERRLANELLASRQETRWEAFDRCYSQLYGELEWLNGLISARQDPSLKIRLRLWQRMLGPPPQRIYEIGSGKAELIHHLAQVGYSCRATEVTAERGQKHVQAHPHLTWGVTDGVHLEQFEPPNTYDAVISDNVIEHLHPDDLPSHLRGVWGILMPGGRYLFSTPHCYAGPMDVSRLFGCRWSAGLHLREYTYRELTKLCRAAGFTKVQAVWTPPLRGAAYTQRLEPRISSGYRRYQQSLEWILGWIPPAAGRRTLSRAFRLIFFNPTIYLVAWKRSNSIDRWA